MFHAGHVALRVFKPVGVYECVQKEIAYRDKLLKNKDVMARYVPPFTWSAFRRGLRLDARRTLCPALRGELFEKARPKFQFLMEKEVHSRKAQEKRRKKEEARNAAARNSTRPAARVRAVDASTTSAAPPAQNKKRGKKV